MKASDEIFSDERTPGYGDFGAGAESTDFKLRPPVLGSGGMSYLAFMAIGEGGMARVFLARARGPGGFEKLVVLKTIRRSALSNPNVRRLFVEEARLCAQLSHPNLVQVYDVDLDAQSPCLVMEYLEGKSLNEVLLQGILSRVMLLTICSEVLAGLHYAHELRGFDGQLMNVVHRDVSPHNVFVSYDGTAKVLDFGIAKMAGAVSDTATEEVKGKLSYMAPEQLMGNAVDRRADIFAVGVLLWEIAVGRRMWDGIAQPAMMHRLATGDIPQVPLDSGVDADLAAIVHKATAAQVAERYATALELRTALDAYILRQGRRPAMRQVGQILAAEFAQEREQTAARIRLALKQREGSSEPAGPAESDVEGDELAEFAAPKRRGWWVLAAVLLLVGGAVAWSLLTPGQSAESPSAGPDMIAGPDVNRPPSAEVGTEPAAPGLVPGRTSDDTQVPDESGAIPTGAEKTSGDTLAPDDATDDETEAADEASAAQSPAAPRKAPTKRWKPPRTAPRPAAAPAPAEPAPEVETRPAASPPKPAPAVSCNPPFFYKDGIKTYRPECL